MNSWFGVVAVDEPAPHASYRLRDHRDYGAHESQARQMFQTPLVALVVVRKLKPLQL